LPGVARPEHFGQPVWWYWWVVTFYPILRPYPWSITSMVTTVAIE
jgi:hypothetical protein